jgi:hypothetical protein
MSDELARRMTGGPTYFPHTLDLAADRLLFVELSEAQIAEASFLDQRLLTKESKGGWAELGDVLARAELLTRDDAQWIFHIGHVGSTLVSRLLGRLPEVLALREPLLVRSLADMAVAREAIDARWSPTETDARVGTLRRLLARTFRPEQRAMIKATSFTSEAAPMLIGAEGQALFLYTSLDTYLRTILAGEASRRELAMLTGPRLARLARRIDDVPWRSWALSEGERCALGWATEMLSLRAAADALPPGAVLWLDFDDVLARPAEALASIAGHFGLALSAADAARLAADPLMQRYSKAPEHAYSAALRRDVLARAEREHGEAIGAGRCWLAAAAARYPEMARLHGSLAAAPL